METTELTFRNLQRVLMQYAETVVQQYRENLTASDRIASGELINNITYSVQENGQWYEVVLTLEDYWKYVEYDTRPHFPPVSKILEWVRVKPVLPRPGANGKLPTEKQLAYLIARKISIVGTEGSHDLRDAVSLTTEQWREKIRIALMKDLRDQLDKTLRKITSLQERAF